MVENARGRHLLIGKGLKWGERSLDLLIAED